MSRNTLPLAGRRKLSFASEAGAAAVEFALVSILLFMLVFGIIEFVFAFHSWDATSNAAREGAREGAVRSDVAVIEARVRAASDFLDQSQLNVSITCDVGATAVSLDAELRAAGSKATSSVSSSPTNTTT